MQSDRQYLLLFLLGAFLLTLWRFSVLTQLDVSLYVDEAQYWYWAQHLDFGYYSKPPVIALIIACTTSILGDGETATRIASILIYPFTAAVIFAIGHRLYSAKVGLMSAFLFLLMPGVSVSSLVISTDVPFFLCWAIALYGFIRALESDQWLWWVIIGVASGIGLQSKYTMGVFAISVVIYLLHRQQWLQWKNPKLWFTAVIAGLIWLPNLWWNAEHGFITFRHTYEISEGAKQLLNWNQLLTFLGGQFGMFGIAAFPILVYLSVTQRDAHSRLLLIFSWTFIAIISLQALQGRANANWAAPAYVAASVLLAQWLSTHQRFWLVLVFALNLLLALILYYPQTMLNSVGIELNAKTDIHKRLRGWPTLGKQYAEIKKKYPEAWLMGSGDRTILSHLAYQARPQQITTWNPVGRIRHHYDLHNTLADIKAESFVYVSKQAPDSRMLQAFEQVKSLGAISTQVYPNYSLNYQVFYLSGFKGYTP